MYMIREQENYVFAWSKKYKLNIKLTTLVIKTHTTPNDTPINQFLPEIVEGHLNTFDEN